MKHKVLFFAILLAVLTMPQVAYAYQFSAAAPSGQMLYYNVVDGNAQVTHQETYNPYYSTYPTGALAIPASVTDGSTTYAVTSIGSCAFFGCSGLTSVTIPDGITSIGDNAFDGCTGMTSVSIPGSVTSIGGFAFYGCSGLLSVTIPDGVTTMDGFTFEGCSGLTSVTIGSGLTFITYGCFEYCSSLTSVNIPDGITAIGSSAFFGCSGLTSVTIGSGVTAIGEDAFKNCSSLSSINIPDGVTAIYDYAFNNCNSLTSITIPAGITAINNGVFSQCFGLTSITIPAGVTYIGYNAFIECSGLTSITIPAGVTSIDHDAFCGCSGLTEIHSLATNPPSVGSYAFYGVPASTSIHVPCDAIGTYQSTSGWSSFTNYQGVFPYSVSVGEFLHGSVNIVQPTCTNPTATLTVTPDVGYTFDHWNDGNTDNPRTVSVTSDTTFGASFEVATHTVTVSNALGSGTYTYGSTAVLAALPQVDLKFTGWSDGETMNPRSIVVTSNVTLEALFAAPDTIRIYDTVTVFDTVINIVYDTTEYNHYYYDTTRTFDTVVNVVYDTTRVFDTVVNIIYDTTWVFDTMVYVNVDTLNHYYYDTTRVFDTMVYVSVDTLNHYYYDTTRVFDTMVYVSVDTLNHYFYDTTENNHYYYDTTVVTHYIFDSTWVFDTLYIFDTVYIHDTVYVGVDEVETVQAKVYVSQGRIVVEGAEGYAVTLYDLSGRVLARRTESGDRRVFDVPATGAYLVKIGDLPARKVVVVR